MACREQVAELRPHIPEIRASGATLTIVGSGAPFFARGFAETMRLGGDVTVLCDASLRSYTMLAFKRGIWSTYRWRALCNYWRAFRSGARQGITRGDSQQQGGVVVVRPGGEIAFRYASDVAGDHPAPARILAAIGRGSDLNLPRTR